MSVGSVHGQIINQSRCRKSIRDDISNGSALKVYDLQEETPFKVKAGVFCTTLAGVAAVMVAALKFKKMPLKNPIDFFKGLTKIKYEHKKCEVEKLVGALAAGSVGGGLIGGALFDKKENMKAKYREAVIQLIGNIGIPLGCVAGGLRIFKHFEPQILKSSKFFKGKMGYVPKIAASALCLAIGILLGNKVGNRINEDVFRVKDNRKIKLSDMSPHIDDGCLALSLVASKSSAIVTRLIPLALMVSGFSTGVAQEHHCKKLDDCV